MSSEGIRCMLMRGGTSRGPFFLEDDLPSDPRIRDRLLLQVMGSPDIRQIDGIGGAHPLTSKVAVVSTSTKPGVDLEYLFLQVGVDTDMVTDRQNCGNMLAGVGPFALERGLIGSSGDRTTVRILMRNTGGIAEATFRTSDGLPVYDGDAGVSGVPGTASPITLRFLDTEGSTTGGSLLPTDNVVDTVDGVEATLIDNGMPLVVLRATDMGITGYETCAELEENQELRTRLESIRLVAGPMMNLGDVTDLSVPKMTMVAPPRNGGTVSTRSFIPHRCHASIGVLAAVTVATACQLEGSVAAGVARFDADSSVLRIEHPTGSIDTDIDEERGPGVINTARKLMDGVVFPRNY